jgi:hypothetical protein
MMLGGCGGSLPSLSSAGGSRTLLSEEPLVTGGYLYAGILNSNPSAVREYKYPYKRRLRGIIKRVALGNECNNGLVVDKAGELFVANQDDNTVTGYATPNYSGRKPGALLTVISKGISAPCGLAVDRKNDLFVENGYGGTTINEYAPPYKRLTHKFSVGCGIGWFAESPDDDLFVQACFVVYEYVRPRWQRRQISNGVNNPTIIAFDPKADLFVANLGNSTITEYRCCTYGGPPIKTVSAAFYSLVDLYVYRDYICFVNKANSTIVCLEPPKYAHALTISTGLSSPGYAVVDAQSDLLVSNCCIGSQGSIAEYEWPWATGNNGGNLHHSIAEEAWALAYTP